MIKKTNPKFFWLLHLAFLRKMIHNLSPEEKKTIEKIGVEIGKRLLDDFCARFKIFDKIRGEDTEKHLKLFLENYIGNVTIHNGTILFNEQISKNQQEIGLFLLKTILREIFKPLNEKISIEVQNEKIYFSYEQKL